MATKKPSLILGGIKWYFDRHRERVDRLQPAKHADLAMRWDLQAVVGCALDVLSRHWAELFMPCLVPVVMFDPNGQPRRKPNGTVKKTAAPAGKRWQAFLEKHACGTKVFDKISGPMLADELVALGKPSEADAIRRLVRDTDNERYGEVRFFDQDPVFAPFTGDQAVVALGLEPSLLERFRFGELLYAEHRCAWVHSLRVGENIASLGDDDTNRFTDMLLRPRYENMGLRPHKALPHHPIVEQRRPMFTLTWLLHVYAEAITSLEKDCVAAMVDPSDLD